MEVWYGVGYPCHIYFPVHEAKLYFIVNLKKWNAEVVWLVFEGQTMLLRTAAQKSDIRFYIDMLIIPVRKH